MTRKSKVTVSNINKMRRKLISKALEETDTARILKVYCLINRSRMSFQEKNNAMNYLLRKDYNNEMLLIILDNYFEDFVHILS